MIHRSYFQSIQKQIETGGKVVILYGPRQAGKTTLVKEIIKKLPYKILEINADQSRYLDILSSRDLERMKTLVGDYDMLFIDEAQRITNIGINLKILHDELPDLRIIATGSSSFELANQIKEPLTGRTKTFLLYPIGLYELSQQQTFVEVDKQLGSFLQFGLYPGLFSIESTHEKIEYLSEITGSYLYKDVLELSSIRYSEKIRKLLKLLAFQIGSQVSIEELGRSLEMSKETVSHYIDLLEKSFVIFRLSGFSRNLRKEVTKMDKIYFWDIGIRNAVIDDFKPIEARSDKGAIWENFLIAERRKSIAYSRGRGIGYFWRTYDRQEIDYLEEKDGMLQAFEIKAKSKKSKPPIAFSKAYPDASFSVVHRENYWKFIRLEE